MLNRSVLEGLAPRPKAAGERQRIWDAYVNALLSDQTQGWFEKYGLDTEKRIEHALAQWAWESGGFTIIWESGKYSQKQIMNIFGVGRHSARVTVAESYKLAGNGYALFERVYGLGNPKKARELGNTEIGDGFNCRGLGIQQLTGKAAHESYSKRIGVDRKMLANAGASILVAILEWNDKKCSPLADRDDIRGITKRINGGYNGFEGRKVLWRKAQRLVRPEHFRKTQRDGLAIGAADGDVGNGEVRELQSLLIGAGYPCPLDGDFGNLTERQLAAFQAQHDLTVSKVADAATMAALREAQQDNEAKPPKTEVRNVEMADLRENGSVQVAVHDQNTFIGKIMKRLGWGSEATGGFGAADHQLGLLDNAENLVGDGQRAKAVASQAHDLAFGLPPQLVIYGLLMLVGGLFIFGGYMLIRNSRKGLDDRLESARSGANLST